MNKSSRIYIAGHRGLVGSAILRRLMADGYTNIITRTSQELNLINHQDTEAFFAKEKPEYVFLAAAKVGGIHANNTYRAEFIYENLMIQSNVIHQSYLHGVKRLLFLGSSCIYRRLCPQPIREEYLLTGPLEKTNSPYAIAKIAGIEMCWAYNSQYGTRFIPVMPTNLYGENDNFNLENSHVLLALLRKFHLAKMVMEENLEAVKIDENRFGPFHMNFKKALNITADYKLINKSIVPTVTIWGTGTPRREFLHVDDMADACVFIMDKEYPALQAAACSRNDLLFNIGTGRDYTIKELALMVKDAVGFQGDIIFNSSMPDGTPQKILDVSRMRTLDWQEKTRLEEGIRRFYNWYLG